MRNLTLVTLSLLMSCSGHKSEVTETQIDSVRNVTDSLEAVSASSSQGELTSVDSGVYIGPMYTFSSSQEYYTPIYYLQDKIDEASQQKLLHSVDSVLYEGEDETRSRLPMAIAEANFNLVGLDTISIFDRKGMKLYRARLMRVEYYDTSIEGEYIAVYKPIGKVKFAEEVAYCVSKGEHSLEEQHSSWQEIKDQSLTDKLLKTFKVDSQNVWRVTHTKFIEDNVIYSTVALHGDGSFLAKTEYNESTILNRLTDNTVFIQLYPVHLRSENKPVFLAEMGINETDAIWVSLLIYSDGEYKVMPRDRIGIR